MNLKEAFQAQNKIDELFNQAANYLMDFENVTKTLEKHFRSKSANEKDEELDVTNYDKKIYDANKVIKFLLFLIDEREKLAKAIREKKFAMDFDFDSSVDVNKNRHAALNIFRKMQDLKSSSVLKKNYGIGYVFNNEGNQTSYKYDVEIIKTIDFDRKKVRELVKKMQKKADEISNEIDSILVNTQIDYELPFDSHGNLAVILEEFA